MYVLNSNSGHSAVVQILKDLQLKYIGSYRITGFNDVVVVSIPVH